MQLGTPAQERTCEKLHVNQNVSGACAVWLSIAVNDKIGHACIHAGTIPVPPLIVRIAAEMNTHLETFQRVPCIPLDELRPERFVNVYMGLAEWKMGREMSRIIDWEGQQEKKNQLGDAADLWRDNYLELPAYAVS